MSKASKGEARLGMLFDLSPSQGGDAGKPIFNSGDENYLEFTAENIMNVLERLPQLEAVHPEIQSLTDETVKCAADHGLFITTWGWLEKSPLRDKDFAAATLAALDMCSRHEVALEFITDHIVDMRNFLDAHGYGKFNLMTNTSH